MPLLFYRMSNFFVTSVLNSSLTLGLATIFKIVLRLAFEAAIFFTSVSVRQANNLHLFGSYFKQSDIFVVERWIGIEWKVSLARYSSLGVGEVCNKLFSFINFRNCYISFYD